MDHIKVFSSNLAGAEFDLFNACLQSKVMHRRQPIKEDRYKRGPGRDGGYFTNYDFAWPIEYTDVFQFLQSGDWPGFATPRK